MQNISSIFWHIKYLNGNMLGAFAEAENGLRNLDFSGAGAFAGGTVCLCSESGAVAGEFQSTIEPPHLRSASAKFLGSGAKISVRPNSGIPNAEPSNEIFWRCKNRWG